MKISGSVCVVTGGSSGLGEAVALLLAGQGAKVASIDMIRPDTSRSGIEDWVLDVTDEDAVGRTTDALVRQHGAIDICVNCAGIVTGGSVFGREGALPPDRFRRTIDVNLTGTFLVMSAAAKAMAVNTPNDDGERGVIVNTASISATDPSISVSYAASKAGVAAMSLTAAHDLAPYGIRVNSVAPGYMDTPMFSALPPERVRQLVGNTVFPKRLGYPSEFARLVAHIIENAFINATTIRCDGGTRGAASAPG